MRTMLTLGLGLLAGTPAFAAKGHHHRPVAAQPATGTTGGAIAQAPAPTGDAAPAPAGEAKPKKTHKKGHKTAKGTEGAKAPEAAPAK